MLHIQRMRRGERMRVSSMNQLPTKKGYDTMDPLLTEYLDAEEDIARGLWCPGCGAAWHQDIYRPRRGATHHSLKSSSTSWSLRHELECPFRQAFARGHLGRLVGELLAELEHACAAFTDPITVHYGVADEIAPSVWRGYNRRCEEILAHYGVTMNEVLHMADERCSPKWTYFSGLGAMQDED